MRHFIRRLTMVKGLEEARSSICSVAFNNDSKEKGYREAVKALNLLQTNASVLEEIREKRKLGLVERKDKFAETGKFLTRSGVSFEELDALPIIHVAGTKGKGSTCAFCESILRHYGMGKRKHSCGSRGTSDECQSIKTGLYTSPHMVEVRERIQLNGKPVSQKLFTSYFWNVYDMLMGKRDDEKDMPSYFKFLTVLAFNVFIREGVDVAVIEVGIGGEKDCTNIIRKPIAVGITSLGIDHQKILGETLSEIAWQKAGIMKKGSPAFTSLGQPPVALSILKERAKEKEVTLKVCPPLSSYFDGHLPVINLHMSSNFQELNASLALQLSNTWIQWYQHSSKDDAIDTSMDVSMAPPFMVEASMIAGLKECKWPGRTQILRWDDSVNSPVRKSIESHGNGITFFLDGAHTCESIELCLEWFEKESHKISSSSCKICTGAYDAEDDASKTVRVLLFNSTGDRDIDVLLAPFAKSKLFHYVLFSPNNARCSVDLDSDQTNLNVTKDKVMTRCQEHMKVWLKFNQEAQLNIFPCVMEALEFLKKLPLSLAPAEVEIQILVSGSLHLVGSVLGIIDPNMSSLNDREEHTSNSFDTSRQGDHAQQSTSICLPLPSSVPAPCST